MLKNSQGQSFYYRYDQAGNLLAVTTDVVAPVVLPGTVALNVGMQSTLDISGGNPMGAHVYYASGLPAGLRIDPLTGRILGQVTAAPGNYRVSYWAMAGMQKSVVQGFVVNVSAFPASMAGTFDALMTDVNGGELTGRVEITVSALGAYTGSLLYRDGKSYTLTGVMTVASDNSKATAALSVNRTAGLSPLVVTLGVFSNDTVSVSLREGQIPRGISRDGVRRGAFSAANPAPWKGTYTVIMENAVWKPNIPEGIGYASVKIAETGRMNITGRMADGSTLTGSMYGSAGGVFLIYLRPYAAADSYLAGWLKMVSVGGAPPVFRANLAGGSELAWRKVGAAADKSYRAGFGPLKLEPNMLLWTPPVAGQSVAVKLGLASNGIFGATIQGGGLDSTGAATAGVAAAIAGSNSFAARAAVPSAGGTGVGNNSSATKEVGEPAHNGNSGGASMWWSWTPAVSGTAIIHTEGSSFDTVLAVYTGGAVNALNFVASDDDNGAGSTSLVSFNVVAGTQYQIAVDGFGGRKGAINLTVIAPTSNLPPNTYGVPAWLALGSANRITTAEHSFATLSGSVDPATGVFKTSFVISDRVVANGKAKIVTRTVPFEGVFLENSGGDLGAGFFLLPPLWTWDTSYSGGGVLTVTPPRAAYP